MVYFQSINSKLREKKFCVKKFNCKFFNRVKALCCRVNVLLNNLVFLFSENPGACGFRC